jgi:hypothetical protein
MQAGLAGTVGKSLKGRHSKTIDAANVDDARGVVRSRCFLQERSHKLGEVEDAVQIEGKDTGKGLAGVLVVGGAPVRTGVVDEDMKLCRTGLLKS